MKTVVIQIGNTDDKLSQRQWSEYVRRMDELIQVNSKTVHFHGGSSFDTSWQNAVWVFELGTNDIEAMEFRNVVADLRQRFQQDSVAFTVGKTEMI